MSRKDYRFHGAGKRRSNEKQEPQKNPGPSPFIVPVPRQPVAGRNRSEGHSGEGGRERGGGGRVGGDGNSDAYADDKNFKIESQRLPIELRVVSSSMNPTVASYTREVPDYRSPGQSVVQTIYVSEYRAGLVKIRLYVNGAFAGTWIKTAPQFQNIVEWGNWKHCGTGIQVQ